MVDDVRIFSLPLNHVKQHCRGYKNLDCNVFLLEIKPVCHGKEKQSCCCGFQCGLVGVSHQKFWATFGCFFSVAWPRHHLEGGQSVAHGKLGQSRKQHDIGVRSVAHVHIQSAHCFFFAPGILSHHHEHRERQLGVVQTHVFPFSFWVGVERCMCHGGMLC